MKTMRIDLRAAAEALLILYGSLPIQLLARFSTILQYVHADVFLSDHGSCHVRGSRTILYVQDPALSPVAKTERERH